MILSIFSHFFAKKQRILPPKNLTPWDAFWGGKAKCHLAGDQKYYYPVKMIVKGGVKYGLRKIYEKLWYG
jgi:hypothetical protein